MASKKNILLLIADDLGRDTSTYDPQSPAKTPYLTELAESGSIFTHAFTSTASCSPSRSVIYTGLHTHTNGNYGLSDSWDCFCTFPDIDSAPKLFNNLGYSTGIIGKVHVAPPEVYPWTFREESGRRDVAWVADRAEAFIRGAQRNGQPFFLTVGYIDPHRDMSQRAGFGNRDSGYDERIKDKKYSPSEVEVPEYLSDLPEVRTELAEYYRSIHRLDQGIGLVLEKLKSTDVENDTMVIFLSDNGPPFPNSKTTLYDAGVRLPLLIRQPGAIPGIRNPNFVSWVDILPTMLDWTGNSQLNAKEASRRRGRSILPIMSSSGEVQSWDRVYGSHTFHEITNFWPTRFIRMKRFKYHRNVAWKLDFTLAADLYASLSWDGMRNSAEKTGEAMIGPRKLRDYIRRPPEELYDLDADLAEVKNLANEEDYQDTVKELRSDLERWQLVTRDPFLYRDGMSVLRMKPYLRDEGLKVPDRWDFDVESPGNRDGKMLTMDMFR